jgi:anti-anti-sigma factor
MSSIMNITGATVLDSKVRGIQISYCEIEPGIGYVTLQGRLDIRNVPKVELIFEAMTATQQKDVIVNLQSVELLNSVGLGMLISNGNALSALGLRMILFHPQPRVERVIRLARVDSVLPIEHDLQSALKRIKSPRVA